MVARGDLGMEIPSEKVPLAQKMLITKSNVAGRFVICATQMLESMCTNPLPTRAEMTDVANAVFDGADATMLSGETANGAYPADAVATMAAISANAELAHTSQAAISFIRDHTQRPFTTLESAAASAAGGAVDCDAELIVVVTGTGAASRVMSKYRPSCPVLVVTADEAVGDRRVRSSRSSPWWWTTSRRVNSRGIRSRPRSQRRRRWDCTRVTARTSSCSRDPAAATPTSAHSCLSSSKHSCTYQPRRVRTCSYLIRRPRLLSYHEGRFVVIENNTVK